MNNIDIVVIGQNYSTSLGLIQAAGEAGFAVGAVHYSAHYPKRLPLEFRSRYVSDFFIADRQDEQGVISLLIKHFSRDTHKVVLLPSDDYSVVLLDRNIEILEDFFYVPTIRHKAGEIIRCMDKNEQSRMAIEAGLSTARCWVLDFDETGNYRVPIELSYPCILKPLRSVGSPKSYIRRCNNQYELLKQLDDISHVKPCTLLVEEFINIDVEYTIPVLAIGENVLIPAFLQKTRIGMGSHKGVTVTGKVVSSLQFPRVVERLQKLIKRSGLQGIFDIELFRSGDMFFFNELNLRYGAAGYALTRSGINMPALWIDYCKGKSLCYDGIFFKDGLTFASDKAAIEIYRAGYMKWKDYREAVSSVDFRFLIDNPDYPIKWGFRWIVIKAFISRLIKH